MEPTYIYFFHFPVHHQGKNVYIWIKNKNKNRMRAWVLGGKLDRKLSFNFERPNQGSVWLQIKNQNISYI